MRLRMAQIAAAPAPRDRWLRNAAEQGSRSALAQLARAGDEWAEERLAESGDADWLRSAAERALAKGDALRAWTWQYLALEHGADLTSRRWPHTTMVGSVTGSSGRGRFGRGQLPRTCRWNCCASGRRCRPRLLWARV